MIDEFVCPECGMKGHLAWMLTGVAYLPTDFSKGYFSHTYWEDIQTNDLDNMGLCCYACGYLLHYEGCKRVRTEEQYKLWLEKYGK